MSSGVTQSYCGPEKCYEEGCPKTAAVWFACPQCEGPRDPRMGLTSQSSYMLCRGHANGWACRICWRYATSSDLQTDSDALAASSDLRTESDALAPQPAAASSSDTGGRTGSSGTVDARPPTVPERYLVAVAFPVVGGFVWRSHVPAEDFRCQRPHVLVRKPNGSEEMWLFFRQHAAEVLRWILDNPQCELGLICGSLGDDYLLRLARALAQCLLGPAWAEGKVREAGESLVSESGGRIHLFGWDCVEAAPGGSRKLVAPLMHRLPQFAEYSIVIVDWRKPNFREYGANTFCVSPYVQDIDSTWPWEVPPDAELLRVLHYLQRLVDERPGDVREFLQREPFAAGP